MTTWIFLAAKEAVIASGLGASVVPALGPGAIDGFAVGALVTGASILAVTTPWRARRAQRARRELLATGPASSALARASATPVPVPVPAPVPAPVLASVPVRIPVPVPVPAPVPASVPVRIPVPVPVPASVPASFPVPVPAEHPLAALGDAAGETVVGAWPGRAPGRPGGGPPVAAGRVPGQPGGGGPAAGGRVPGQPGGAHRRAGDPPKRPEARRGAARHAAPAAGFSSMMTSRSAVRGLASAGG